ncbi:MAG: UDP-N-acetylmuramoyl-tripeptide--D-alanyl-D-alanine ligase [Bacteroidota bacterium]|nr:UDP-N-acetylmuramoyl-tripeptide--D-alanyl-D-alanine ligase [Bacteroidota bacterium]
MQLYPIFLQHPIICTDSRVCPTGSLFFALKGENFNANAFALSALENGCAYAVVDEAEFAIDNRFILVQDVLETLQQLASYHRKQLGTTVIAITGTNGKTTTKELIAAVLKEKYNILFTQGNLNNHIGVPLTLLQLQPEHQIAVIEMGANHPGEIKQLCDIVHPDYGIVTNVGKAHLEGFGSLEGVMRTKAELYESIAATGKLIFINTGNSLLTSMATTAGFLLPDKKLGYSLNAEDPEAEYYAGITTCNPFLQLNWKKKGEKPVEVKTQLIGSYNAENVLAAVTIGDYFGLTNEQIKKGLEKYIPQNNRSQLTHTEKNKLVVDTYNANPTSMRAAILNFAQLEVAQKTLILGDMFELGSQSDAEHQNIVDLLQQKGFKNVLLVGKDFKKTQNSYPSFENVSELIGYIQENPLTNNYILIKGSRGMKLEGVLPSL